MEEVGRGWALRRGAGWKGRGQKRRGGEMAMDV